MRNTAPKRIVDKNGKSTTVHVKRGAPTAPRRLPSVAPVASTTEIALDEHADLKESFSRAFPEAEAVTMNSHPDDKHLAARIRVHHDGGGLTIVSVGHDEQIVSITTGTNSLQSPAVKGSRIEREVLAAFSGA